MLHLIGLNRCSPRQRSTAATALLFLTAACLALLLSIPVAGDGGRCSFVTNNSARP